jgi:inner membrane protein
MAETFRVPTRSLGLKLLLVCALAALMSIPAIFVGIVFWDRMSQSDKATNEISQTVGGQQTLLGPVLAVAYTVPSPDPKEPSYNGYYVVYPETGAATAKLDVKPKSRSIYVVPVFDSDVTFDAQFAAISKTPRDLPSNARVDWDRARLIMGVSDLRGAKSEAVLTLPGGATRTFEPAAETQAGGYALNVIGVPAADLAAAGAPFSVKAQMRITGAKRFAFLPFAKATKTAISSNWADPSFEGGFLPGDNRTITEQGFNASWDVPYLARNVAAAQASPSLSFDNLFTRDMAVKLVKEDTAYRFIARSLKYSPLFIGLVFIAYFLFEVSSGRRVHPAQFILIGLAQAVFYLLLLAFSEHIGFDAAFLVAAVAAVGQIGLYAGAVFGSKAYAIRALAVFAGVYALLYVLMRLEAYALVVGAIASFVAIALTMWMTRNVDWYGGAQAPESSALKGA